MVKPESGVTVMSRVMGMFEQVEEDGVMRMQAAFVSKVIWKETVPLRLSSPET